MPDRVIMVRESTIKEMRGTGVFRHVLQDRGIYQRAALSRKILNKQSKRSLMADDYTHSLREKLDLLIVERNRLRLDVEILTEENKKLREKVEHFRKLEAEAASHVEAVICARTNFTGEEPYIGWKGLGLALREALDERDRLREAAHKVAFHYFNCEGQCGKLRQAVAQLAKASGYSDRAVRRRLRLLRTISNQHAAPPLPEGRGFRGRSELMSNCKFRRTVLRSKTELIEERPYGTYRIQELGYLLRKSGTGSSSQSVYYNSYHSSPYVEGDEL